jgi:hypothetical protein
VSKRLIFLCILPLFLSTGAVAQPATPPEATLWDHNGSVVYLIANGSSREFYYKQPRSGMLEAGARPGSLLFHGRSINGRYSGVAFIFDRRCGQVPYQVSGPILDNYERVVMTGHAPRLGPDCRVEEYSTDTLEFTLLKPGEVPIPRAERPRPSLGERILIPLQREGGTYVVPVLINNAIKLNFVVDSGAADVSIPADVVSTLLRTGTLSEADFIGTQTYRLADGSTMPSARFRIRSLIIGGNVVENVIGSIAPAEGALLLGQSFLSRFNSWSIDNGKQALVLEP